jgi:hypothetical protein
MGCVAVALAALVSYPAIGLGATDCSYGGAIIPPLPVDPVTQACVAAGPVRARHTLDITLNNPLQIDPPGSTLRVENSLPFAFFLPGSFIIDGALVASNLSPGADILEQITIDARGEIRNNNGVLLLVAPFDQVRLTGRARIILNGNSASLDPSTFLWGDYVKLATANGNIELTNTVIFSTQGGMDFVAPKGDIILHDTTLFSIQDGGNTIAPCRFQPKVVNHQLVGNVVGLPNTPTADPSNVLICIPQIIKD